MESTTLRASPTLSLFHFLSPHVESKIKNLCSNTSLFHSSKIQGATVVFHCILFSSELKNISHLLVFKVFEE